MRELRTPARCRSVLHQLRPPRRRLVPRGQRRAGSAGSLSLVRDDVPPPGSSPTNPPPRTDATLAGPPPEWSSNDRVRTPRSRRAEGSRSGWLPWAVGATGLILVALIGALLLVTGDDEADPGAGSAPRDRAGDPATTQSSSPSASAGPTRPKPTESLPARAGPLDLVRYTAVDVPDTAPPNVDVSGNEVRYDAANMLDGVAETCWRMPGSGADDEIVFTFEAPVELTRGRADQRLRQDLGRLRLVQRQPPGPCRRMGLRRRHRRRADPRRDTQAAVPADPSRHDYDRHLATGRGQRAWPGSCRPRLHRDQRRVPGRGPGLGSAVRITVRRALLRPSRRPPATRPGG